MQGREVCKFPLLPGTHVCAVCRPWLLYEFCHFFHFLRRSAGLILFPPALGTDLAAADDLCGAECVPGNVESSVVHKSLLLFCFKVHPSLNPAITRQLFPLQRLNTAPDTRWYPVIPSDNVKK